MKSSQSNVDTPKIGVLKCSKIAKQKFREKENQSLRQKEFKIIVNIPKELNQKQYLRTEVDLIFSTDYQVDSNLGELCTNIFSIGYQVLQTDNFPDKQVFTLSPRNLQCVKMDVIYDLLDKMNLPQSKENIKKFISEHMQQKIQISSMQDLFYLDSYASQFPYESYIIRYDENGSQVLQYINNSKYIQLMGITVEMMERNYSNSKILPCAIKVESYLDVWNQMFGAVSKKSSYLEVEIQNYNGKRQFVVLEQRLLYLKQEFDNSLYCYLYWIYKTHPDPQLGLKNYQDELDQQNPKPKECRYRLK